MSHQFDFVAIRFKLRVALKNIRPAAVQIRRIVLLTVKTGHGLSERVLLFTAATAAVATGRTAVRRLVQRKTHLPDCGWQPTAVHKLQLLVGLPKRIFTLEIFLTVQFDFPHPDSETSCERAGVQLHLVAVGGFVWISFHKGNRLRASRHPSSGTVFLNTGGKDINIHLPQVLGF